MSTEARLDSQPWIFRGCTQGSRNGKRSQSGPENEAPVTAPSHRPRQRIRRCHPGAVTPAILSRVPFASLGRPHCGTEPIRTRKRSTEPAPPRPCGLALAQPIAERSQSDPKTKHRTRSCGLALAQPIAERSQSGPENEAPNPPRPAPAASPSRNPLRNRANPPLAEPIAERSQSATGPGITGRRLHKVR